MMSENNNYVEIFELEIFDRFGAALAQQFLNLGGKVPKS